MAAMEFRRFMIDRRDKKKTRIMTNVAMLSRRGRRKMGSVPLQSADSRGEKNREKNKALISKRERGGGTMNVSKSGERG